MCARLTPREQEILLELAKGYEGNKCLARHMNISTTTLNNHLAAMYIKTGTTNKTQLVLWAFRQAKRTLARETALTMTYCDCGMVAHWRGRVQIAAGSGYQRDYWLHLCEGCKEDFEGEIKPL